MAQRSSNAAAEDTNKESQSENITFRVRGVPANWGREQLQHCLMNQVNGLHMSIRSLATEAGEQYQSATIAFQNLPPQLQNHLNWDIIVPDTSNAEFAGERCLNIDKDFYGLTTLFAPPPREHKIDIIALSGLGSHAFGSFRQRKGPNMWLRDSLPYDLTSETTNKPMARIMIYGYESDVVNSNNTQNLEDLATAFHNSLLAIATGSTLKPIIFIGHSLGGLNIKQVSYLLICLSRSEFQQDKEFLGAVYGVVFFGTPHDGMDIRALISMAGDGPNRFLLESISRNSQVLSTQQRDFCSALEGQKQSEVFCFYETLESPTAVQDEFGRWTNTGHAAILVTKSSATHCRPWEDGPEHICAIARTHSGIVKFGRYDTAYKNVRERMRSLSKRALAAGDQPQEETAKCM
ncbi:hypothetical protein M441DRAFT_146152 [Trichoderma asperellum CBS 433.97]|uniref:DUF676 domain-containing protein n=1 Tax=Trichoderma asperellum (strain ATCC 204424 / CBS 433.97 / NBRC 101777) TaxID=1042311 RepID=A0A2T3Z1W8_TRIA4|nr:hypothetical protein M441DRAFT_146152 [Trichoderma asperellum CBS 433.97]PTB38804.1 hypothetical protein M441DRAFT_146152 [Trichoderma asperellum CBS 433.97]